jgi:hypothetical protein
MNFIDSDFEESKRGHFARVSRLFVWLRTGQRPSIGVNWFIRG